MSEILENLQVSSLRSRRNLSVAKQHLQELRLCAKRLNEQLSELQEQVKTITEKRKK
jgi:hypothetical protein